MNLTELPNDYPVISITDGVETFQSVEELGNTKTIGKKDWTINLDRNLLSEMEELKEELNKMKGKMKFMENEFVGGKVVNTAVQVILFLAGTQPKRGGRFEYFADEDDARIMDCVNELGVQHSHFKQITNALVAGRNSDFHFEGVESLEAAVQKALETVDTFPGLRRKHKTAVLILENFDVLSKYFP
jgi:hypothetical protein